jgi:hypothetical protein
MATRIAEHDDLAMRWQSSCADLFDRLRQERIIP